MLMYAQDEVGSVLARIGGGSRQALQGNAAAGGRSGRLLFDAAHQPLGKYHVQVCTNISCLITGGEELYEQAKKQLGIGNKEVTADGMLSLEEVECMGACSWAPAIQVNYDFHHNVTPEKLDRLLGI